jgi:hypothetical protein
VVLLDEKGNLVTWDLRAARKLASSVYTQRMPKGGPPLTDQEVGELMALVDTMK